MSIFKGVYCAVQIAIQRDTVCEAARDVNVKLHCGGQGWDFEENGFAIRREGGRFDSVDIPALFAGTLQLWRTVVFSPAVLPTLHPPVLRILGGRWRKRCVEVDD